MYFDKGAVVDVGDVAFEGETESNTAPAGFLNPNTPTNSPESVPMTHNTDISTEMTPISAHDTQPSRPCHNSLKGLPQYNPQQYGCRKMRCATQKDKTALIVEGNNGLEASKADFENTTEAELLHKAVHEAMSAVTEDQPPIKSAINRPDLDQWK